MHQCPVTLPDQTQCPAELDDGLLMDAPHWRLVPVPIQRAVYRAYNRGEGLGTERLAAAQQAAVDVVNRRLAGDG